MLTGWIFATMVLSKEKRKIDDIKEITTLIHASLPFGRGTDSPLGMGRSR